MTSPYSQTSIHWNKLIPWLLIAIAFGVLLYALSDILTPFLLGAVLAYLCNPFVIALEKRRLPRPWGSLLTMALLASIILLVVLLIVPLLWREARLLVGRLPQTIDAIQNIGLPWLQKHFGITLQLDADTLRTWIAEHWSNAG
ncbi:MAG TPA: AI-2E family transporter, partial [Rhodocyclaceae bacterium]|nr:AI-2E family transporter [Rhodocyclaceae bacterium]